MAVQIFAVGLAVQLARVLLAVFLRFLFRELLGLFLRLPLGLLLQPLPLRPHLGALLLALLLAGFAFAADRLEIGLEVIGAVVVIDLLARLDVLDGADEHLPLAWANVGFSV